MFRTARITAVSAVFAAALVLASSAFAVPARDPSSTTQPVRAAVTHTVVSQSSDTTLAIWLAGGALFVALATAVVGLTRSGSSLRSAQS